MIKKKERKNSSVDWHYNIRMQKKKRVVTRLESLQHNLQDILDVIQDYLTYKEFSKYHQLPKKG